jgi:hypothetical protein
MSQAKEATALQRKIFSRWVNQKIAAKGKKIKDVVDDFKNGDALIWLLEVLSEKEFQNWKKIQGGSRMKQIDSCNQALEFLQQCGVEMKTKTSSENLVDGTEMPVMGMIWAIMLKFMKLDDGEDDGTKPVAFSDALKMWIQNQVTSYGLSVDNMTKSFHDGKVFCALINKFRPKLLDYNKTCSDSAANLKMAFNAAETYFGLEQYLQVSDIAKLDDKSMVVYASEYYYGIAQQRKVDLAAKRVATLIDYTKENDRLKEDYTKRALTLRERMEKNLPTLGDTTIENTMAGAIRRLELFNQYRKNEKAYIFSEAFSMDSMYQNIARRLLSHKRPEFIPNRGCSVAEINATIKDIEKIEAAQNVALHNELNRQIKLAKIFENYTAKYNVLQGWIGVQRHYLEAKVNITSVGGAKFALNQLQTYNTAYAAQAHTLPAWHAWKSELAENKFEHQATADKYASDIATAMKDLETKAAHKQRVHEDDLARETLRAAILARNDDHIAMHGKQEKNAQDAIAAHSRKETINSIKEAEYHLGLTRSIHERNADNRQNVPALKAIGDEIRAAKHKSEFSEWKFEEPQTVTDRETCLERAFADADQKGAAKLVILEDDLEREMYKQKVMLMNDRHVNDLKLTEGWVADNKAYLNVVEPFDSIADAEKNLKVLSTHVADKELAIKTSLASFLKLGKDILDANYNRLSKWAWEDRKQIQDRLDYIPASLAELDKLHSAKKAKLDADLAKEIRKEWLRVEWAKLTGEFLDESRDVCASAPTTMFGFVLEEVEAFAKTLQDMDSKVDAQTKDFQGKYDAVWAEMIQLGVRTPENPYSKLTPDDMAKLRADLAAALQARQARFHAELEKLRADDKACRDLAGAADPFVRKIQDNTKAIADCKLDLDPFLALVISVSGSPTKEELSAVAAFQKVVDDRKIIYNRHTLNNGSDCATQLAQYQDYTKGKKESIEADIEHRNLRGLTRENYTEIKQQFDQFDKDKSGFLDKREFRSCLYSVGEERGRKEIEAILTKLGNGDANNVKISYDGYKEFMIEQLGDTDTQEEVLKGFALMNRQEATCQWPVMQNIMDQAYLDYIKSTHGADYTAWVKSVFAR